MASKSAQSEPEKAEVIEGLLDHCDTTLDRLKTLYEQFFLGIQKQPPTYLHTDVERKLRELQQIQIRNTALRYRFATIQQKFGSYNNYWRRTLRQIENGTYHRNLAKIGRQAAQTGADIPEEILAAMPKRMREQVKRDREVAIAQQRRREGMPNDVDVNMEFVDEDTTGVKPTPIKKRSSGGAHVLDEGDGEFDLDAYFAAVTNDDAAPAASISRPAMPAMSAKPTVAEDPSPEARPFEDEEAVAIVSRPAPASVPPPMHDRALRRTPIPRVTSAVPTPPAPRPQQVSPALRESQAIATTAIPTIRDPGAARLPIPQDTGAIPTMAIPTVRTPPAGLPAIPAPGMPAIPAPGRPMAPSQVARPLPVMPGAATARGPVPVETLAGPFPREQPQPTKAPPPSPAKTQAIPRPPPPPLPSTQAIPKVTSAIPKVTTAIPRPEAPRQAPPPGMTDADVNALYAKYVKAKEAVGEKAGPGSYGKLLQTINAQAPKIMEQYKAKGVDFQVVVKDNQVVIRAKPKP